MSCSMISCNVSSRCIINQRQLLMRLLCYSQFSVFCKLNIQLLQNIYISHRPKLNISKQNIMTTGKISKNTPAKKRQISIEDFFGKDNNKKVKTVHIVKTPVSSPLSSTATISSTTSVGKPSPNDSHLSSDKIKEDNQPQDNETVVKDPKKNVLRQHLDPQKLSLLNLELLTMDHSWFMKLQSEFTKNYFLELKSFLQNEQASHTVFPPPRDIYSWTRLTPFDKVKVVIIGQDPYHNFNQAHGLAFSVKEPTPAPPSLKNIYRELKNNYPDFKIDNSRGDLSCWASQGVLLLNTSLTVRAHNANSHANHGWEVFTSRVVELLIKDRENNGRKLVFLLWGKNAINLVENLLKKVSKENKRDWRSFNNLLVLKSVHPSPLSANRGFFGNNHFKKINDWLYHEKKEKMIDWSVVPGCKIKEIEENNNNNNK